MIGSDPVARTIALRLDLRVADADAPRTLDARPGRGAGRCPSRESQGASLGPCLVVVVRHLEVAPLERGGGVRASPAIASRAPGAWRAPSSASPRSQQGLRRDAGPVRALASDQFALCGPDLHAAIREARLRTTVPARTGGRSRTRRTSRLDRGVGRSPLSPGSRTRATPAPDRAPRVARSARSAAACLCQAHGQPIRTSLASWRWRNRRKDKQITRRADRRQVRPEGAGQRASTHSSPSTVALGAVGSAPDEEPRVEADLHLPPA